MREVLMDTQIEAARRLWLKGFSTHEIAKKLLVPEFLIANSMEKIRKNNLKKG